MRHILKSTVILTIGTLLIKTITMSFRVFISGKLGPVGMGMYQLIFSAYLMIVTIAYSGINTAVMRLTGEGKIHPNNIIKGAMSVGIPLGFFAAVVLYVFAPFISHNILRTPDTMNALRMLAPSVPVMCVSASFIAYFIGKGKLFRPLMVQAIEQITRLILGNMIIGNWMQKGLAHGLTATTFCMTIGEFVSFFLFIVLFWFEDKEENRHRDKNVVRKLLNISVPLAANNYLVTGLATTENILLPIKLSAYDPVGAIAMYGMLEGMALPMIMFPSSLLTSLATILMPNIAKNVADGDNRAVQQTLSKVLKFTTIASVLIVTVFLTFPYQLGMVVYKNTAVGDLVVVLSGLCPIIYLEMVVSSVLTGLNLQKYTLKVNMLEASITLSIILFFVSKYGFKAYLAALIIGALVGGTLKLIKMMRATGITIELTSLLILPAMSAIIASVVSRIISGLFLWNRYSLLTAIVLGITVLSAVYFILLLFTGLIKFGTIKASKNKGIKNEKQIFTHVKKRNVRIRNRSV